MIVQVETTMSVFLTVDTAAMTVKSAKVLTPNLASMAQCEFIDVWNDDMTHAVDSDHRALALLVLDESEWPQPEWEA